MGKLETYIIVHQSSLAIHNVCISSQDYFSGVNCKFIRWVDPPALDPYQEYIAYLHSVIANLKLRSATRLLLTTTLIKKFPFVLIGSAAAHAIYNEELSDRLYEFPEACGY
jgi:hypothetical protein